MVFYVGNTHTASVSAEVVKAVRCEHCGSLYFYEMSREGQATAESPFFLMESSARDSAQRKATKLLRKKLAAGCDPVKCPDCERYQARMVQKLARKKYGWLGNAVLLVPIAFVVASVIYMANKRFEMNSPLVLLPLVGAVVIGGILHVLKSRLIAAYDPAVTPPRRGRVPPALKLLNNPADFAMPPQVDLYFAYAEQVNAALQSRSATPPDACLVVPAGGPVME